MTSTDPRALRAALGQFATGVTVVTTFDAEGRPVGVTANSFNSVSLDPPLVLWSLARKAQSLPAFQEAGQFAVHILGLDQRSMSDRFARSGEDKFAGVSYERSAEGVPLFEGCAARFLCRTAYQYEGGDHVIFVGEVVGFESGDSDPLLFHGGRYREARSAVPGDSGDAVDTEAATFSEDFLSYLLSRAHFQLSQPVFERCRQWELTETEMLCLSTLSLAGGIGLDALKARLAHTGRGPGGPELESLVARGLLLAEGSPVTYRLSEEGRRRVVELLANAKASEETLRDGLTEVEFADLRELLRKVVRLTAGDAPSLWLRDPQA